MILPIQEEVAPVFAAIVRYYSYIFHGLLALFLIAVSGVALAVGPGSLHLDMLPWTGSTLTYVVLFGGLFGLLTVVLAIRRQLPVLFFIWSLVVAIMLIKGYIFSGYGFEPGGFSTAVELIVGSLIAIAGPWSQMRPSKR
jgi:hypothetical protein